MKTTRRSHFTSLGSCLAAIFGLLSKPVAANPVRCASSDPNPFPPTRHGLKGVVSPDGRTRTYRNARGEVVHIDRFDERGRMVELVTMEARSDEVCITYGAG